MKRWITLAALVVVITTTATVVVQYLPTDSSPGEVSFPAAAKNSGPKPLAVVDGELTHHFGMAAQNVKIKKDWVIRNEGKADMVLTKGVVACICTVAEFEGEKESKSITLKPGQETVIHLSFDTKDNNGPYHKSAEIITNDPLSPALEFVADGTVRPSVVLYPPEPTINYLDISNDQDDHHGSILLYSPDQPDIKITQLVSSRPGQVVVTEEPMSAEDCKAFNVEKGLRINIDVTGEMPLGIFREQVVVKTDHPKQPELKLTVAGRMVGPISSQFDRMRLSPVHSSLGETKSMMLTVRGLRPTTFEVVRKPDNVEVAVTSSDPSGPGGQYLLTVKVPPGMPPGIIEQQIVLKTDHPKASEIKIPIDIEVQAD